MCVKLRTGCRLCLEQSAINRLQRKPGGMALADAEDRIDRSGGPELGDRLPAQLRKLIVDQCFNLIGIDVYLVAVHRYRVRPNSRSISAFLSST